MVVIRSSVMGEGDPELGKVLLKGFIYAISQQKDLPKTMLFIMAVHLSPVKVPSRWRI